MFWPRQARRDLALYGLPNFYSLRADVLSFSRWTHVYDTRPLLPTLTRHVDFAELNASDTAFVVTAVDVESGVLKRFSNKKLDKTERTIIEPQHVLASGSLPPQFPWTEFKEGKGARRYWDGGIVSNTPLQYILDEERTRDLVVYQVDLFAARGPMPRTLIESAEREKDIRYSSRTRLNTDRARQRQALAEAARRLFARLPESFADDPDLMALKGATVERAVSVVHLIYRRASHETHSKDYEFSRTSMLEHWAAGMTDTQTTLEDPRWLGREVPSHGVHVFDFAATDHDVAKTITPTSSPRTLSP